MGKKQLLVAIATGYTVEWVRELARRYNRSGIEGLGGLAKGECGCTAEKTILEGNLFEMKFKQHNYYKLFKDQPRMVGYGMEEKWQTG